MEDKELEKLGDKIYDLRQLNEISQEELAKRVGVSRQTIMRWESNLAKPKYDKLVLICKALCVGVEYLMPKNGLWEEDSESDDEDDDFDETVCDEAAEKAEESITQAKQETTNKKISLSNKVKIIISSIVFSIFSLSCLTAAIYDKMTTRPSEGSIEMVEDIVWNFSIENIGWLIFTLAMTAAVVMGIVLICRYVIIKKMMKIENNDKLNKL